MANSVIFLASFVSKGKPNCPKSFNPNPIKRLFVNKIIE